MSTPKLKWQPCFVDPWRGVAHFDGITIEADPITSARPNRVLPCIEDEQVLFCRMVEAILGKEGAGKIAIDLGTGSGVLALHAASRLGINVTGVDCCKRAIAFAEHNNLKNKTQLQAGRGSVEFKSGDYLTEEWIAPQQEKADYVFLNAPFSPGLPGAILPRCANGGTDGQASFLSAVSTASELLKAGGRLFAIQLLLTDEAGNPRQNLFSGGQGSPRWSSMRLFSVLSEPPIPVAMFLAKECRDQPQNSEPPAQDSASRFFSLCFLEFTKGEETGTVEASLVPRDESPLGEIPAWTWDERLTWHRAVLENTSPAGPENSAKEEHLVPGESTLPSIALFLDRSHAPLDRNNESKDPALSDTQAILNRWIRRNGMLLTQSDSLNPSFDCIMVESAPWHPAQRRLDLRTETAIWSHNHSPNQDSSASEQENPIAKTLVRILHEIEHINTKKRSVFRHPALEEGGEHRLWQHAIFSVFRENDPEASALIAASTDLAGPQEKPQSTDKEPAVTHSKNAATYLHPLKQFNIGEKNPSTTPLETCITAALHAYTGICRQEGLLGEGDATCYFCSLPLPSPQPLSPAGTSGTLYVYGWSTHPWSPDHETAIADLARTSASLYEEAYSEEAKMEIGRLSRNRLLESAAHETRKLCYAIQPGLSWDYANYIRDFLNLFLQIRPLGDTFLDPLKLLPSEPDDALRRLSEAAYIYQNLAQREWNAKQLTSERLKEWRTQSAHIEVCVEDNPGSLDSAALTGKDALHFVSAFVAAVRNAIKHTPADSGALLVRMYNKHIAIQNRYQSESDRNKDTAPFNTKQVRWRAGETEAFGSEQVIQYHVGQYQYVGFSQHDYTFIKNKSCENTTHGRYQHTWETIIPFPASLFKPVNRLA